VPQVASLVQVRGAVTVSHAGVTAPAREGRELSPRDAVETAEDASAVLRLASGRVVELGPDGRFELDASGSGTELTVSRGLVLTRRPAPGLPEQGLTLTISTPFGLTRIGEGQARVTVHARGAEVEVLVGELELVPALGPARKLSAGAVANLGAPRALPTIRLFLVGGGGQAEVRPEGASAWRPLTAARRPELKVGDRLRVQRGRVAVAPEGSPTRLELLAGAEASVLPSVRGSGQESTGLDMAAGALEVSTPPGQRTRVAVGGGLVLVSPEGGRFSLRRQGQLVEVSSTVGDARLLRDGQPDVVLPGGSLARLVPAGATVTARARDAVQLPSRAGLEVFQGTPRRVSLVWDTPPGPDGFQVVVASTASLAGPILEGRVRDGFVSVPTPANGALHWRVSAGGQEVARGSARFAPERQGRDLKLQRNQVPDGPETTSIYFQDRPPAVTFTWAAFPGAVRYAVKVYREGDLATALVERTASEPTQVLAEGALGEGTYRWSVTPLDAGGVALQGGRLNRLELVYDNAVPHLIIRSPRDGAAASPSGVAVTGVAPLGAAVFVNGHQVTLDLHGRFDERVIPLPGGVVVFRVVQGGAEAYTIRSVR
jgi:hypothetical protein